IGSTAPSSSALAIPEWLFRKTPKKKKKVPLGDVIDLSILEHMPKRQAKRPRTMSSLTVNPSGEWVIEVATPVEGKTKETITAVDYRISKFSLGKATHEGAKQD
ncbi:hypothetical protein KI387_037469, partial [Taxus chinensis]